MIFCSVLLDDVKSFRIATFYPTEFQPTTARQPGMFEMKHSHGPTRHTRHTRTSGLHSHVPSAWNTCPLLHPLEKLHSSFTTPSVSPRTRSGQNAQRSGLASSGSVHAPPARTSSLSQLVASLLVSTRRLHSSSGWPSSPLFHSSLPPPREHLESAWRVTGTPMMLAKWIKSSILHFFFHHKLITNRSVPSENRNFRSNAFSSSHSNAKRIFLMIPKLHNCSRYLFDFQAWTKAELRLPGSFRHRWWLETEKAMTKALMGRNKNVLLCQL